jgi:hypothetical protein
MPPGSRANQIWTHRVASRFLDTFGRPDPNQDPPCERIVEPTMTQTLHLMNAPRLQAKVADKQGTAARLAAAQLADQDVLEELYLRVYCRLPNEEERAVAGQVLADAGSDTAARQQAIEDLLWALLNTPEFLFKD